jgi:DNA-binding CsgD family transcriptional regulator/tetratricopeptide (TPR) repeat protein
VLIGRDSERHVLARAVSGARVEATSALVLVGEAGIGKSALLADAVEQARDMQVLKAAGSRPEREVAFAGLHQLLRPVLPALDRIPGPQADALSIALALREGVIADRFAVGAACLSLFSVCAEERALLVVVDDAHLWDRPSAEAVAFAVRRLVADRVAFLAASRPLDGVPLLESGLPQLHLGGLDAVACEELVRRSSDRVVAPETMTRLQDASGGNPLALEELSRDLDVIEGLPPGTPVPVPRALADSFRRRTEGLSALGREVLVLAALCDGDLALTAHAAQHLGADVSALAEAESAGLVRIEAGEALFRHPLVAAGVYTDAGPAVRRRTHLAVAAALPEQDLERRTWHRAAAATGPDEVLAAELREVGRRADRRGAHAVATTAFERAAALVPVSDRSLVGERAACYLAAGESAWLAGQAARAEQLLERAEEDPGNAVAVSGLRGTIALRAGSLELARTLLRRTAEAAAPQDPVTAIGLLADLVTACFYLGAARDGLTVARRIEELLDRPVPDSARVLGRMAAGVARVIAGEDGIDQIRTAVAELGSTPAWADDQRRPAWTVLGPLFLRESDIGRALVDHAMNELRQQCALGTLPMLLFHTARVDATSDRWQAARSAYDEGIRLARETGETTDLAMSLAGLAWLEARMDLRDDSRAHAHEAAELAAGHQIHVARAWTDYALGDLALVGGSVTEAVDRYAELDRLLAEIGFLDVDLSPGPERVEALVRLGRQEEAAPIAGTYHRRARAMGQPWALARAERALGIGAASGTEAERHFSAALELHAATPDLFECARTQLAYGAALRRTRKRVAARPPLRAAVATFGELGAPAWLEQAVVELEATGDVAQRPGESPLTSLTPQELHIARLLGSGQTTREAAGTLFLSPKTVEYHLRHIYTKLGIRSRDELAAVVAGR